MYDVWYFLIIPYGLVYILWLPTEDNGHHCCWRASLISIKHRGPHKYINFYIYFVNNILNLFNCGLEKKNMHKATHPLPEAWHHQIHAAWGESGSITMVMVLWGHLCFLCGLWFVTCQSESSYIHFGGITLWVTQACTTPWLVLICGCHFPLGVWRSRTTKINSLHKESTPTEKYNIILASREKC
jgi:hypothetical protein